MSQILTEEQIRSAVMYEPQTGHFQINGRGARGWVESTGYRRVYVLGRVILAHRLAWFMHYGVGPIGRIDHINRVRDDNRIENLRLANATQNAVNREDKASRYGRGVEKNGNTYRASVWCGRRRERLGPFNTPEEAAQAYRVRSAELHGDFVPWK